MMIDKRTVPKMKQNAPIDPLTTPQRSKELKPLVPEGTLKPSPKTADEIAVEVDESLPTPSEVRRFVFDTFQSLLAACETRDPLQPHDEAAIGRLWRVSIKAGEKMISDFRKPAGLLKAARERQIRTKTLFDA
jgi:hypothetical protein